MILTFTYRIDAELVYRSDISSFKKIVELAVLICTIVQRAESARKESEAHK